MKAKNQIISFCLDPVFSVSYTTIALGSTFSLSQGIETLHLISPQDSKSHFSFFYMYNIDT